MVYWFDANALMLFSGLYKPRTGRTGRCMNHAPAILAAPALIYSTHRLLVVWIIVAHFHLCSLLDRYTILELRRHSTRQHPGLVTYFLP